jgi:hypothetical protein
MNRTVESAKTLLVNGPASVLIVSGRVEVFGFSVKDARRILIREGKRLPLAFVEAANFDVSLGENASVEEIDGNTISQSWIESFDVFRGFSEEASYRHGFGKS